MYVKTCVKGEPRTVSGTPESPATITDVTEGAKLEFIGTLEPMYSGSGTPSLTNVRPISGRIELALRAGSSDDPDEYDVSFSDIGSVYGGTYNSKTGLLTVTKVIQVVTSVTTRTVYGDNRRFRGFTTSRANNLGASTYLICDKIEPSYQDVMVAPSSANGTYIAVSTNANYSFVYILLPSSVADTVAQANSWLSTNRPTICYELETPIEYHLTPQNITAVSGENVVVSSADTFTVSYSDYEKKYTNIRNLQFAPEVDITTSEVLINEFTVDILSDDMFIIGREAYLCDNSDNVWAKYYIYSADRTSTEIVQLNARSILWKLNNRTMSQSMYHEELASTVISRIFSGLDSEYVLDSSFDNATITGYLPQQSARERLHEVCFTIGAYINTCFTDKIEILPVDTTATLIPQNKTYWRPSVEYSEYITAVRIEYYEYWEQYPSVVDDWVEANGKYYIKTAKTAELKNPNAPDTAPENVAEVSDIGIIHEGNVDEVLSRLANFYFQRIVLTADIINNGEYVPANLYTIATGINAEYPVITGYMSSASFTFGHQAKSRVTISQSQEVEAVDIIILYMYQGRELDAETFTIPDGFMFKITNPYLSTVDYVGESIASTVYYPLRENAEGTAQTSGTYEEEYEVALGQYKYQATSDLRIYAVDDLDYANNDLTIKGGENE